MKVRNRRPVAVEVPALNNATVEPGGVVDVDDVLGASMCEQVDNWAEVPAEKPAKAGKDYDSK